MARYIEGAENCPTRIGSITPIGAKGNPGKSAYQVAVDNGFVGTEAEWLTSLKGEQGEQGDPGISYVSLQDEYDAWRAEHPSDNIVGFLRTITATGLYTFFDNDYLAIYELTFSTEDGEAGEYYGHLEEYDEGAVDWRHFVYTGETVETLTRNENLEPVNRKFLADQHYLSASATPTSSTAGMQDVYRDNETGKLMTPAGGGGGTQEVLVINATMREDASGYHISITDDILFDDVVAAFNGTNGTKKIVMLRTVPVEGDTSVVNNYELEAKVYFVAANSLMFAANFGTQTMYATMQKRSNGTPFFLAASIKVFSFATSIENASDKTFPSTLAVKTYADNAIAAALGDTAGALTALDNTLDGLDSLIGGDGA